MYGLKRVDVKKLHLLLKMIICKLSQGELWNVFCLCFSNVRTFHFYPFMSSEFIVRIFLDWTKWAIFEFVWFMLLNQFFFVTQTSSPGNTRGWLLAAKDEFYILSSRWSLNPHPAAKLISQYTSSVPVDRIENNYILPKSFPVHLAAKHTVIQ